MTLDIPEDKHQFLIKQFESGISATVISRAFQRRFGAIMTPQDVEKYRVAAVKPKRREDVEAIKAKLGSHDEQLEWARAKLRQRMEDDEITNNDLVNLARELRSNISTSQQIASMNDEKGEAQFVLVYNDTVKSASPGAIIDAEFTIEDGS